MDLIEPVSAAAAIRMGDEIVAATGGAAWATGLSKTFWSASRHKAQPTNKDRDEMRPDIFMGSGMLSRLTRFDFIYWGQDWPLYG